MQHTEAHLCSTASSEVCKLAPVPHTQDHTDKSCCCTVAIKSQKRLQLLSLTFKRINLQGLVSICCLRAGIHRKQWVFYVICQLSPFSTILKSLLKVTCVVFANTSEHTGYIIYNPAKGFTLFYWSTGESNTPRNAIMCQQMQ